VFGSPPNSGQQLFGGRHHLRHAPHARITRVQIIVFVKNPITGFDELSRSDTHPVTNSSDNSSIPVQFQELAILSACHPRVAVRIEMERANEISHLHRSEELPIAAVDDNPILFPVADPDIAVCRINRQPMDRTTD
jgi:hypothetical protein